MNLVEEISRDSTPTIKILPTNKVINISHTESPEGLLRICLAIKLSLKKFKEYLLLKPMFMTQMSKTNLNKNKINNKDHHKGRI